MIVCFGRDIDKFISMGEAVISLASPLLST